MKQLKKKTRAATLLFRNVFVVVELYVQYCKVHGLRVEVAAHLYTSFVKRAIMFSQKLLWMRMEVVLHCMNPTCG